MKVEKNAKKLCVFKEFCGAVNKHSVTQNLNATSKALSADGAVLKFLSRYATQRQIERLKEVQSIRLVESVEPHDDHDFIREGGMRKSVLMVVTSSTSAQKLFQDSPECAYFFSSGGWRSLNEGDVLWFDASRPHAMITAAPFNIVTFWFSKGGGGSQQN